jgi:gamma-aminobutyric acid type B receptor
VAFSSKGDRIAWTLIEQMINGQYNKVGYYDTQTDNLTWLAEARWIGGKIPQDRTIIIGTYIIANLFLKKVQFIYRY